MTFLIPRTENQKFHLASMDSEDNLKRGKMVNRHLVCDNNRDNVSSIGKNKGAQKTYKISELYNQYTHLFILIYKYKPRRALAYILLRTRIILLWATKNKKAQLKKSTRRTVQIPNSRM